MAAGNPVKVAHTIVLDAGAIIKNEPSVSSLLSQFDELVTVPAILSEIKDAATRSRVEMTLRPFLKVRSPHPASYKFVADFARKTGDLSVLSKADIEIIALTYEIECERNGGDWRVRNAPGQKKLNGVPPSKPTHDNLPSAISPSSGDGSNEDPSSTPNTIDRQAPSLYSDGTDSFKRNADEAEQTSSNIRQEGVPTDLQVSSRTQDLEVAELVAPISQVTLAEDSVDCPPPVASPSPATDDGSSKISETDSDSEGWITPSNLKKKQVQDASQSMTESSETRPMQVAVLTSDFAMQNVILQINLNLLSSSLSRVKHLRTYVLRCHACFQITKDMGKQFCPKCGQPALTRVSCSTNSKGEFTVHLKRDMQWNNRGNRYSIPKPAHGSANSKTHGGGKGGWGHNLILAEDQKEFQRATEEEKRRKERSLMDDDCLPDILTGQRGKQGGRIKVGAGRNVNAKKR